MEMKRLLKNNLTQLVGATLFSIALTACGDDSSSSAEDDYSSSVASFRSSSSLSTRADIDYKDTIQIGDTARINIELLTSDTLKDPTETYIDSADISVPMYLGEFPKGSRIKVYATTFNIAEDRIRIKHELGDYLKAITAVPKSAFSQDSIYDNYIVASLGSDTSATFRDSNQFVAFKDGHYFLEVSGDFSNESNLRLKVTVDSTYYKYTGDEDSVSMKMTDTLRGILEIDKAPEEISIAFSANDGYAVNLTTTGKNIVSYKLTNGDSLLGESSINIDTMLVPNDSVDWNIKISAESFSNFKTGPFAFFEAITKARQLEQGEYFSFPDSILYPGENFVRTRPKDNMGIYKYHLRQEQFVWLGNYKKGDSVIVYHSIENYTDNDFESPVTYEILDKDQKVRGSISSVNGGAFSVKGDMPEGPYYLHYLRLKSNPKDQVFDSLRYVLQLTTLVQQPGLLKTMKFYDDEKMASYNTKTLAVGDSIYFDKFTFQMTQIEDTDWDIIGSDISWLVPCASLNYINLGTNPYKESSCEDNDNKEQEIASNHLIVLDAIGETALLIAQSTADPAKRDTLKISIIAKSNSF